jgi:hypothetical protein
MHIYIYLYIIVLQNSVSPSLGHSNLVNTDDSKERKNPLYFEMTQNDASMSSVNSLASGSNGTTKHDASGASLDRASELEDVSWLHSILLTDARY